MSVIDLLLIVGCGGHARSVADVALLSGTLEIIFWDSNARENETLFGFQVLSDKSIFDKHKTVFLGIGANHERAEFFGQFKEKNIINVVSDMAYVASTSTLARGVFVAHGAHIGPMAIIGDNTIINTHAVVEHECVIGVHSHISVNSSISGRCKIGDFVFVGAGAVVKDKISVCSNVTIGAGCVVVKDIIEPGIYVGSPARKIK